MIRWLLVLLLLVAARAEAYDTWASGASGNWTTAATWQKIDASSSTGTPAGYGAAGSLQDDEAGSSGLTTSYACSTAFQWAATGPVVDAVAVKVYARAASPSTHTFTICLNDSSTGANCGAGNNTGRATTLLASDLDDLQDIHQGWVMVKFAGTVTPVATTNYYVCAKESNVAAGVYLMRNSTVSPPNWSRLLRTTTTGAPAANDVLHILGDWPNDTQNAYTVYVSTVDTTNYGQAYLLQCTAGSTPTSCCTGSFAGASCPPQGITISKGGTLKYGPSTGPAATTSYGLKIQGTMEIFSSGEFDMGKCTNRDYSGACAAGGSSNNFVDASAVATPSTFTMNSTANIDTGLVIASGGILNAYGSNTPSIVKDLLAADAANGATTITTTQSTGWLNGQSIVLSSTSQTAADSEVKALTGNCAGTSCAITALATAATTSMCNTTCASNNCNHCGVAPTQADLGLLSHSLVIQGASASLQGYVLALAGSQVVLRYAESKWMGSATANKRGFDVQSTTCTTTPCFDAQYSSFHDNSVASTITINITGGSSNNVTISNNIFWNNINTHVSVAVTTGAWTIDNNLFIGNQAQSAGIIAVTNDIGGTFTNNTMSSSGGSGWLVGFDTVLTTPVSFANNTSHSNSQHGIKFGGLIFPATISTTTVWRNLQYGLHFDTPSYGLTLNGVTAFGNAIGSLLIQQVGALRIRGFVSNSDAKYTSVAAVSSNASFTTANVVIDSGSFDVAAGSGGNARTAHTNFHSVITGSHVMQLLCVNCTLSPTAVIGTQTFMPIGAYVAFQRFNGTAGDYRYYDREGTLSSDSTYYHTAAPGVRMVGNANAVAATRLQSGGVDGEKCVTLASGQKATVSAWVCPNSAVTAYNGVAPRVMRKVNQALYGSGDTADEVIATGTTTTGTCVGTGGTGWQQLSGTTAAATTDAGVACFYVDGTGTGLLQVDDWATN